MVGKKIVVKKYVVRLSAILTTRSKCSLRLTGGSTLIVLHHVGHMAIAIETAHLWLHRVARLWTGGEFEAARLAAARVRYLVEQLAEDVVRRCMRACGARSLIRPSPVERIYRDLGFYLRHDSDDQVLSTIGRDVLGDPADISFFRAVRS